LLDFSRTFPPRRQDRRLKNSHLFHLLRPELVKSYPKPLCSDAYSGFVHVHSSDEHICEVDMATAVLLGEIIPRLAADLNALDAEARASVDVKAALHSEGVNLRYLGAVRRHVSEEDLRSRLLIEMLARTIKHTLRKKMRQLMRRLRCPLASPFRSMVIRYMNLVFGTSAESAQYWDVKLRRRVRANFPHSLSAAEKMGGTDFKALAMRGSAICRLFALVVQMTALRLRTKCVHEFTANASLFDFRSPFDETDLVEIGVVVRHMNIMALAQGYVLKSKGRDKTSGDNATRLYQLAMEKFEEALFANPGDKKALRELADTANLLGQNARADRFFALSIEADPTDPHALFKYAVFLESQGKPEDAEEYFLQALERDPLHDHCIQLYADFLESQGHYDAAEAFYIRAAECRASRASAAKLAAEHEQASDDNIDSGIFAN
jgi:Translation initiation factor eIF3 subunit 135/Tetratricopeptide repeat